MQHNDLPDFVGLAWMYENFPHLPPKQSHDFREAGQHYYLAGLRCEREGLLTQALRCYVRSLLIESESPNTRSTRQTELHDRMRAVLDAIHRTRSEESIAHANQRRRRESLVRLDHSPVAQHEKDWEERMRLNAPIKAKSPYVRERIKAIRLEHHKSKR